MTEQRRSLCRRAPIESFAGLQRDIGASALRTAAARRVRGNALLARRALAHLRERAFRGIGDAQRVLEERRPGLREPHTLAAPLEEPRAERRLERADAP